MSHNFHSENKPPSQELRKVLFSHESLILKFALKSRLMLFSCFDTCEVSCHVIACSCEHFVFSCAVLCSEVGTAKVCFLPPTPAHNSMERGAGCAAFILEVRIQF